MTYIAYLDEFGLAGFVLPIEEVRGFGTWFFQRKCELLAFE